MHQWLRRLSGDDLIYVYLNDSDELSGIIAVRNCAISASGAVVTSAAAKKVKKGAGKQAKRSDGGDDEADAVIVSEDEPQRATDASKSKKRGKSDKTGKDEGSVKGAPSAVVVIESPFITATPVDVDEVPPHGSDGSDVPKKSKKQKASRATASDERRVGVDADVSAEACKSAFTSVQGKKAADDKPVTSATASKDSKKRQRA